MCISSFSFSEVGIIFRLQMSIIFRLQMRRLGLSKIIAQSNAHDEQESGLYSVLSGLQNLCS